VQAVVSQTGTDEASAGRMPDTRKGSMEGALAMLKPGFGRAGKYRESVGC